MRALSRWVKREYGELRIGPRRRRLRDQLRERFRRPLVLSRAGSRGRDSVYLAKDVRGVLGAVRLHNPFLHRKPLATDSPFVALDSRARLEREWCCYDLASRHQLSPRPLWRDEDALMCEYLPGRRLSDVLAEESGRFWSLIRYASATLNALHQIGLTHMDASLANVIANEDTPGFRLIDFEYGPAALLNLGQQMAYDHLRLLESSIKFMPPGGAPGAADWLSDLDRGVADEARRADTRPLAPALARVLASDELRVGLAGIFPGLRTDASS